MLHDPAPTARHHTFRELRQGILRLQMSGLRERDREKSHEAWKATLMVWQRKVLDIVADDGAVTVWNLAEAEKSADAQQSLDKAVAMALIKAQVCLFVCVDAVRANEKHKWLAFDSNERIRRSGSVCRWVGDVAMRLHAPLVHVHKCEESSEHTTLLRCAVRSARTAHVLYPC
jgi:hypothetical protein